MKVTKNNILCPILHWFSIHSVRCYANSVAHVLARYARHISFDVFCLEDSSTPAMKALYSDLDHLQL